MKTVKPLKKMKKPISILLIAWTVWISLPYGYASAAMVGTEAVSSALHGRQARDRIRSLLAREKLQTLLIEHGINMEEAKNRIGSLTDAEALRLGNEIEKLPAGGDAWTTLIVASLLVFFVLLITDIAGYTDVFPFVKKSN